MQVKLFLNSAYDLKNVNWRYGDLQPYAVAWIDSSGKCSTKIDVTNGVNPVWNEMFTIALMSTSHPETAILYIDIVHAIVAADMKPLIGSVKLPLGAALDESRSKGKANFSLILERPSGRPQGNLEIQIEFLDSNNIQREPYGQQSRQMPLQPQPQTYGQQAQYMQPQMQPRPQPRPLPQPCVQQVQYMSPQPQPRPQPQPYIQQVQYMPSQPKPQPQYQLRQMNQYAIRPGYPTNLPQNVRPALGQQPGNAMMMQNMRPQNSSAAQIGNVLCTLALGVSPMQIGRMVNSLGRTFRGPQQANGMLNNTVNVGNGGANVIPGNYPPGQQGYDNTGYDATATSDSGNYCDGQFGTDAGYADGQIGMDGGYSDGQFCTDGGYADGQFCTDGGYADGQFGMDGSGFGGCDDGGVDMGMFGDGGFNFGSDC